MRDTWSERAWSARGRRPKQLQDSLEVSADHALGYLLTSCRKWRESAHEDELETLRELARESGVRLAVIVAQKRAHTAC
eukprot:3736263-Pleurochrysis_carterae.AAC.1